MTINVIVSDVTYSRNNPCDCFDVNYNEDKPRTIHVIVSDVIDNEDVIELLQSAKQVNLEPKF